MSMAIAKPWYCKGLFVVPVTEPIVAKFRMFS